MGHAVLLVGSRLQMDVMDAMGVGRYRNAMWSEPVRLVQLLVSSEWRLVTMSAMYS